MSGFASGERNLAAGSQDAVGVTKRDPFNAGFVVTIAGVVLGVSALGTALAVSGTGCQGHLACEYKGDCVIMRLQVDLSRLAGSPQWACGK